ncbi:MAG: hypothetical protein C4291_08085 [Candidatus Dadabacteria bacterium]
MKIRGVVEALNEREVKLGGKWYGIYTEEIPKPKEGMEVEIETKRGMIRKLNVIKTMPEISPAERPRILEGFTELVETVWGDLYITVNTLEGKPFEILVRIAESDRGIGDTCGTIGRLVSLALRSGIGVKSILEELQGIDKSSPNGVAASIPGAVAQILIRNFVDEHGKEPEDLVYFEDCPNCNKEGALVLQGGCSTCHSCGFTDCY